MNENFLKLTNTAYRLLEYFPESDQSKYRAKEKVLEVMESLVLVDMDNFKIQNKLSEDIEILLGYFEIGKNQGWISQINYLIISKEYRKIKKEICSFESPAEKKFKIDSSPVLEDTKECTQNPVEPELVESGAQKKEPRNFTKLSNRQ